MDRNKRLNHYPEAKLALEYRADLRALEKELSDSPEAIQTFFYEELNEDPSILLEKLRAKIDSQKTRLKSPYDIHSLKHAYFQEAARLGPDAADEFRYVTDKLGDSIILHELLAKIRNKHRTHIPTGPIPIVIETRENYHSAESDQSNLSEVGQSAAMADKSVSEESNEWIADHNIPWRRYAARIFDYSVIGNLVLFVFSSFMYQVMPYETDNVIADGNRLNELLLTVFLGSFFIGGLIGFSGTTPGKILFGIRVLDLHGRYIGVLEGIKRDIKVCFFGMGMGFPIISFITLYISFRGLRNGKATKWDKDRFNVFYRPSGPKQYLLNALGLILLITMYAISSILNRV